MIAHFRIVEVRPVVGSRLVPSRLDPDFAINHRSGIAGAVCASIAVDAEHVTISADVVRLHAHFEAFNCAFF